MARSRFLMDHGSLTAGGTSRASTAAQPSLDDPLVCLSCGGSLSFLAYGYPFIFGCDQGHFVSFQALFDAILQSPSASNLSPLECWERKSMLLRQVAQRALELGHVFTAADLHSAALRIDHWVSTLQIMFPLSESEALASA